MHVPTFLSWSNTKACLAPFTSKLWRMSFMSFVLMSCIHDRLFSTFSRTLLRQFVSACVQKCVCACCDCMCTMCVCVCVCACVNLLMNECLCKCWRYFLALFFGADIMLAWIIGKNMSNSKSVYMTDYTCMHRYRMNIHTTQTIDCLYVHVCVHVRVHVCVHSHLQDKSGSKNGFQRFLVTVYN